MCKKDRRGFGSEHSEELNSGSGTPSSLSMTHPRRRLLRMIRRPSDNPSISSNPSVDVNADNEQNEDIIRDSSHFSLFEMRPGVELHLYVSDSPCGDASIYEILPQYHQNRGNQESSFPSSSHPGDDTITNHGGVMNHTGAKVIIPTISVNNIKSEQKDDNKDGNNYTKGVDNHNLSMFTIDSTTSNGTSNNEHIIPEKVVFARERNQIKSALRLKSGRSNILPHLRSTSMSCSDKICLWSLLGLQGCGFLSDLISSPIVLSGVAVGYDPRTREGLLASLAKHEHLDNDERDTERNNALVMEGGQLDALYRAIVKRWGEVFDSLSSKMQPIPLSLPSSPRSIMSPSLPTQPSVHVIKTVFSPGKSIAQKEVINRRQEQQSLSNINEKNENYDHENENNDSVMYGKTIVNKKREREGEMTKEEKKRIKRKTINISPCGFSLNWQQAPPPLSTAIVIYSNDEECNKKQNGKNIGYHRINGNNKPGNDDLMEITIGATGMKQGKKPKIPQDVIKHSSRLCRYKMWLQIRKCENMLRSLGWGGLTRDGINERKMTNLEQQNNSIFKIEANERNEKVNHVNEFNIDKDKTFKCDPGKINFSTDKRLSLCQHQDCGSDATEISSRPSYQQYKKLMSSPFIRKRRNFILREMEAGPLREWVISEEGDFYHHTKILKR